jgi:hypothetical protein
MKFLPITLSLLTAVFVFSCTEPEEGGPTVQQQDTVFVGNMSVDQLNNTFYVQDSVRVDFTRDTESGVYKMVMNQVKFSARMPISLTMTVNGISGVEQNGVVALSGDSIVPMAMGGPYPNYTITNLSGVLTADSLNISFKCGTYPRRYKGGR